MIEIGKDKCVPSACLTMKGLLFPTPGKCRIVTSPKETTFSAIGLPSLIHYSFFRCNLIISLCLALIRLFISFNSLTPKSVTSFSAS